MIFIFQYSMDISPFLLVQCWLKHHLFSSIILGRSNVVWRRLIMVFTPIFQLFCVKICLNSAWLTEKMLYSIAVDRFLKGRLDRPLLMSEWENSICTLEFLFTMVLIVIVNILNHQFLIKNSYGESLEIPCSQLGKKLEKKWKYCKIHRTSNEWKRTYLSTFLMIHYVI